MSPTKSHLLANNLPFHPVIFLEPLVQTTIDEIKGHPQDPAIVIAIVIKELLGEHIQHNLEPFLELLKAKYQTTPPDLKMFNYGYTFILNTVIISALCKDTIPSKERFNLFNKTFNSSLDPLVWAMQAKIQADLNATINLYRLDPSAAFVFQFCEDYPFSTNPYFLAGMEAASIVFFSVSQDLSDKMPNLTWLHEWQGISSLS